MSRLEYLEHAGARLECGVVRDFGDAPAERAAAAASCGLFDVSHEDRWRADGADGASFLHRLLTLDVQALDPGRVEPAFLLTSTGKIVCAFHLVRTAPESMLLQAAAGHGAEVHAQLDRFLFGEQVAFEDVAAETAVVSLQGANAEAVLANAGMPQPEAGAHVEAHLAGLDVRIVRRDRIDFDGARPGYDIWMRAEDFEPAWGALVGAGAQPAGADALEALRVEGGVPAWGAEYGPESSPLEVSGVVGIADAKGCYPGQEVIERTLSLGKPPRALVRLSLEADAPAGAQIVADEKPVGLVTSVGTGGGRVAAMGLVKRKVAADGLAVEVAGVAGRVDWVLPLPRHRDDADA
jgi:folate-binding protein YgfZ